MTDAKQRERKEEILEAMKEERGYLPAAWAYAAEKDIDFMEAYNNLYKRSLTPGKALPVKTRELIAIAILAFRGREGGVYEHMKRALRHGATKQELLEAIQTMIIPGGAPTFNVGLSALAKIEEEDKKK